MPASLLRTLMAGLAGGLTLNLVMLLTSVKHYMWVAKKLGVPIKMVSLDGKFSMVYQEITEGSVPAGVFEVPPGYQIMTLPQGMPRRK